MLTHKRTEPGIDGKVVVLGASGFLGGRLTALLDERGVTTSRFGSSAIDLTAEGAAEAMVDAWGPDDALVLLSAITPDRGRGVDVFMANLRMARAVCEAVHKRAPRHLIYLSSDAVYPFVDGPVNERSAPSADDLYGAMHWAREVMLRAAAPGRLAVLRSTMLYGAGDSHNSYGPNRLRRMGREKGEITLFGGGEEMRDHVSVDDAARLVVEVLSWESVGLMNVASGQSVSYDALAREIAASFDTPVEVVHTPRQNPITHRHFDVTSLRRAFPRFILTPLREGLRAAHTAMLEGRDA